MGYLQNASEAERISDWVDWVDWVDWFLRLIKSTRNSMGILRMPALTGVSADHNINTSLALTVYSFPIV